MARGDRLPFSIAILIVTYLHVVIGELVPKALALATREKLVLRLVVPLEGFYIAPSRSSG